MRKAPRPRAPLADLYRIQFAIDVFAPEVEKFAQLWKIGREVEFLPDKSLQSVGLIGHPVDNRRRRQPIFG